MKLMLFDSCDDLVFAVHFLPIFDILESRINMYTKCCYTYSLIEVVMIVITGSKRSGTSLWMQILIAAGFPPYR